MNAVFSWNRRPFRAVIFDMDGVIADTFAAHLKSWGHLFEREGLPLDASDFLNRSFGLGASDSIRLAYENNDLPPDFIAEKAEIKEAHFVELFRAGEVQPVRGVKEFISDLRRRGVPVAVGTSAPLGNLLAMLEVFGLQDSFDAHAHGDEVARTKPAPDIFLLAAQKLRIPPADCLIFEDSKHGLRAAQAAGSGVVCITTMHSPDEVRDICHGAVPDFVEFAAQITWP